MKKLIKSSWLKSAILDNFGYKVISLILAVVLWIFVVVEKQPELGFIVPVTFRNVPKSLTLLNSSRNYDVEIRVKGPQSLINNLTSRQFTLEINLAQAQPGEAFFSIFPQDIKSPRGIRVIRVLPPQLKVVLEPLVSRIVPIEPVILGVPAEDYELKQINVFPPTVKVMGPKSKVEELKNVRTTSLSITGLNKAITQRVDLVLGEDIELAEQVNVEIRAIIREKTEPRALYNVPVQIIPPARGAVIEPRTVSLTLTGPLSMIRSLRIEQLNAFVDIQQLKPEENQLLIQLQLPEHITLVKMEPDSVKVLSTGEEDRLLRPHIGVISR